MSDVERIEVDVFITDHRLAAMDVTQFGGPGAFIGGLTWVAGVVVGGQYHGESVDRQAGPPPLPELGSVQRWIVTVERSRSESVSLYA